jgi:hypothetical protein
MTVKYKQSLCSDSTRLCMSVEVTYLLNTKLICCLSIVTDSDSLVWWEVLVPACLVELASQYHER